MGTDFQVHDAFAMESQGPDPGSHAGAPGHDRPGDHAGAADAAAGDREVQEGGDPPHVVRAAVRNRLDHLVVKSEALASSVDWKTYWQQPAPPSPPVARRPESKRAMHERLRARGAGMVRGAA